MKKIFLLATLSGCLFFLPSCSEEDEWPTLDQINEYLSTGEWEMTAADVKQSFTYKMITKISYDTTFSALEELNACEKDFAYQFLSNNIEFNEGESYCGTSLQTASCSYEILENGRKFLIAGDNILGLSQVLDYFGSDELTFEIEKITASDFVIKQVYTFDEFLEQFGDALGFSSIIDLGIDIEAKMEVIYRFKNK